MIQNRTVYARFLKILLCIFACVTPCAGISAPPISPLFTPKKREVRAVWLTTFRGLDWPTVQVKSEADIVIQKKELIGILDQLQAAHINTVIFQTRVRGNLIYSSSMEAWCESLTGKVGVNPGYDPLAFAIEECHKRGMELHAWMVAVPLGSDEVHKEMGAQSVTKRYPHLCKRFRKHWYLNPGHPDSQKYLASLVNELITKYDVDGVHLDYIRYPDRPKRFPDAAEYRKYGKGKTLYQWRRDNITRLVRAVYQEVKRVKPWVKVSSAPLGKYRNTARYNSGWNGYHDVYQEAQAWMQEGIQDMIFPMLYYRDNYFYPFVLDWKEHSHGRMVVPGLGIYFLHPSEGDWTLDEVERQLNFIRWSGCEGESYFRSRFLTENTQGLYDRVQDRFYHTPALVPAVTWVDDEPPTQPLHVEIEQEGSTMRLAWTQATDNMEGGMRYNVYASHSYPVDTDNPGNLMEAYLTDTCYVYQETSYLPVRHYAVTAIDRCGNESEPVQLRMKELPRPRTLEELKGKRNF